jgi:hypothetical protein
MPAVVGTNVTTGACELRNGSLVGVSVDNSGIASATTATVGTNTTQLATTAFATSQDLGVGQTWQDVTGSRAVGTTYTNTTGKPIQVVAKQAASTGSIILTPAINGVNIATSVGVLNAAVATVSFIVPPNQTYSIALTGSGTVLVWSELR